MPNRVLSAVQGNGGIAGIKDLRTNGTVFHIAAGVGVINPRDDQAAIGECVDCRVMNPAYRRGFNDDFGASRRPIGIVNLRVNVIGVFPAYDKVPIGK